MLVIRRSRALFITSATPSWRTTAREGRLDVLSVRTDKATLVTLVAAVACRRSRRPLALGQLSRSCARFGLIESAAGAQCLSGRRVDAWQDSSPGRAWRHCAQRARTAWAARAAAAVRGDGGT